jgi:hypothetical protein
MEGKVHLKEIKSLLFFKEGSLKSSHPTFDGISLVDVQNSAKIRDDLKAK